jgi:hypothetical protein
MTELPTGRLIDESARECLRARQLLASHARSLSPGYSCCELCGLPWSVVTGHYTHYDENVSCFPLCDECWRILTPDERLPYYRTMFDKWGDKLVAKWELIRDAVFRGD